MPDEIRLKFLVRRTGFVLDVDTTIPGCGVTAVFGRSGSGKTTLLRCLAGLESPEASFLRVNGTVWQDSKEAIFVPPHSREIGYVCQEGALFPGMSVQKNLLFGYRRTPRSIRTAGFQQIVALLGLQPLLSRLPISLSGGEKQRVAIGRALLNHPRLLLMDEPMASLDQFHKKEILPYLETLQQSVHIPVIYITHDREELIHIANHVVLIDDGEITAQGELDQVLTRVDLPIAREEDTAAVIETRILDHDPTFYLTRLGFPGGELRIGWLDRRKGSSLRIRIKAKDVSLFLQPPQNSSFLNVLPAEIDDMQEHGRGRVAVRLNMGGVPILARITQKSRYQLNLKTGDSVYAAIKSVALLG